MASLKSILSIGLLPLSLMFVVSSCSNSDNNSIPVKGKNDPHKATKTETLTYKFDGPIPVDSTAFVMYPLTLGDISKGDEGLKSYSKSGMGPFWNIAFYDTQTGNSSLLAISTPMRINSFQKLKDLIIYQATATDYNGDGRLDQNDPSYLFASTVSGMQFRQISPDRMDVKSFQSSGLSTILIQATADSNGDHKFGAEDVVIPYVFDVQKGGIAKETFSRAFKTEIAKAFDNVYK